MGYSLSAASLASLFHACQSEASTSTTAASEALPSAFFQPGEARAIRGLLDILLPATDTPSASELGVDRLCDLILAEVYSPENQAAFRRGMQHFFTDFADDRALGNATAAQLRTLVERHTTQLSSAERTRVESFWQGSEAPSDPALLPEYERFRFWRSLRQLAIAGYFSSELIATEHLVYLPVPGPYQGCIPLEDVGGTWALR